jgi:DNA replication protein DnaC
MAPDPRWTPTHSWGAGGATIDLLLLDDWGLLGLGAPSRRDLFELIDERHRQRATLITSQLSVEHWHDLIGGPTLADAILDRLVQNAYPTTLEGESMRKRRGPALTANAVTG